MRTSGPKTPPAASPKRPYHVGVAVGLSAGMYAASLAAVTMLQVEQDKRTIADREPVSRAIALLAQHNDISEARLEHATDELTGVSARYDDIAGGIDGLHASVLRLGRNVSRIEGVARAIPNGLDLPAVPRVQRVQRVRSAPAPPPTQGKTGASGQP